MPKLKYKRIVLKLSGESFGSSKECGIDAKKIEELAEKISQIHKIGTDIAIVIGGGNIIRGKLAGVSGIDRQTADYMGMLATVINGMALQDALEKKGIATRLQSAIEMQKVAEPYIRRRAIRHLEKRRIVIFAGGTGSPYFTTDTTAALRATEIGAQVILKATKVDGIYSHDPKVFPRAKKFKHLTYMEVLKRKLKIMDSTAISLCMENNLPIIVFNIEKSGILLKAVVGKPIGTVVS